MFTFYVSGLVKQYPEVFNIHLPHLYHKPSIFFIRKLS